MAQFQVVAVYPSGRRHPVREPHSQFSRAEAHRFHCEKTADPRDDRTYELDIRYIGADGLMHYRGNVTPESLGYSAEEVDSYRWDCDLR